MTTPLLLPDVSEFQSPADGNAPDWAGIKARNGGAAIIRVGYGNAHLDKMLVSNRATIKSLKFGFCGLYQYLRANQDVHSQANAFIGWIGPHLNEGEIPILDLEEGAGDQSGRAAQWFGIIDAAYGLASLPLDRRSWLYSGQSFAVDAGLAPVFNSTRHTWVAAYRASEAGLLPHTLWQCTNGKAGAHITDWPGAGRCDTSLYHGTLAQLAATASGGPAPAPAPEGWTAKMITDLPVLSEGADDAHLPHWWVHRAQLIANGVFHASPQLAADGKFGPATANALKVIQCDYRLPVTGRLDPATWGLLLAGATP